MKVFPKDFPSTVAKAQQDPLWWIENILGGDPWDKQKEIIESVRDNSRTAVRSCNGAGKSWCAARVALWFLHTFPYSVVLTTAFTFRQVKAALWNEIRSAHGRSRYDLGSECLTTDLHIKPKWYALGFSTKDPVAAQGIHAEHVLVIIDEASGVPKEIWNSIDGCLTSNHARLLTIGNPIDPVGAFAEEFKDGTVSKLKISAFDTPNLVNLGIAVADIRDGKWQRKQDKWLKDNPGLPNSQLTTPQWVADKWRRWCGSCIEGEGSPLWRARILGEFPEASDDTLIPLAWVMAAHERWHELEKLNGEIPVLGVDVARFGSDESVIYECYDDRIRLAEAFRKVDTMGTAGRVKNLKIARKAEVVNVDVIGVGGGVVDRLREEGVEVAEANASHRSSEPDRFANARAEWYWKFREGLDPNGDGAQWALDPNDDLLASQLTSIRYKIDGKGRTLLESKDDMRRRGMSSPDRADGAVIATLNIQAQAGFFIV